MQNLQNIKKRFYYHSYKIQNWYHAEIFFKSFFNYVDTYLQNCKYVLLDFTHWCKKLVSLENPSTIKPMYMHKCIKLISRFFFHYYLQNHQTICIELRKKNSIFREINFTESWKSILAHFRRSKTAILSTILAATNFPFQGIFDVFK